MTDAQQLASPPEAPEPHAPSTRAEPTTGPTALVAGCGDLGTEVALRLLDRGDTVLGLRRRTSVLPPTIRGLSVDLTAEVPDLPGGAYERLAVLLTADGSDARAYRETYVGGLRRTLAALDACGVVPRHAVLVSSTGVYGDSTGDLDESSPVAPTRPTHEVLLEAEKVFHEALPHGTVLRLSGLYGPGRSRFVERARRGEVEDHWTNRIHRDDAAAAVVHLLGDAHPSDAGPSDAPDTGGGTSEAAATGSSRRAPLYLGTDREPAHALDVAAEVRRLLGLPPAAPGPRVTEDEGRRLSSDALVGTGFSFTYPTYRQGYAAVLRGHGRRHP